MVHSTHIKTEIWPKFHWCGRPLDYHMWCSPELCLNSNIISKYCSHCGLVMPYRDRFGSILAWVMSCCLTAPSHYLNQCWLAINKIHWHSFQGDIWLNTQDIDPQVIFQIYTFKITAMSPKWVNSLAPGKFEWNFRHIIFMQILVTDGWGILVKLP